MLSGHLFFSPIEAVEDTVVTLVTSPGVSHRNSSKPSQMLTLRSRWDGVHSVETGGRVTLGAERHRVAPLAKVDPLTVRSWRWEVQEVRRALQCTLMQPCSIVGAQRDFSIDSPIQPLINSLNINGLFQPVKLLMML